MVALGLSLIALVFAFYIWFKSKRSKQESEASVATLQGQLEIIYNFGHDLIDDQGIAINGEQIQVPGFNQPLVFDKASRFADMLD